MPRRLRVRKRKVVATPVDKGRLDDQLTSIINKKKRADALNEEISREMTILLKEMQGFKIRMLDVDQGEAEVFTPVGKSCTIVDPMAFHAAVSEEDFYACIKVAVTKAREVLSEKELQTISETKQPCKKDPVLRIKVYKSSDDWE